MTQEAPGVARARALLDVGRPADALPHLGEAIAAGPGSVTPRCLLALALLRLDRPADALTEARQACRIGPEHDWAHRVRSSAHSRLGQHADAVAAAESAVRFGPEKWACHARRAEALVGARRIGDATVAADRAVALAPDEAAARTTASFVAIRAKRWTQAEAHARAALSLCPDDTLAMNNLGVALGKQGRRAEAVDLFVATGRIDPASELARRNTVGAASRFVGWSVRRHRRLPAPARHLLAAHRQQRSRNTPTWCVVGPLFLIVPLALGCLVLGATLVIEPADNTSRAVAAGVAVGALAVLGGCGGVARQQWRQRQQGRR